VMLAAVGERLWVMLDPGRMEYVHIA